MSVVAGHARGTMTKNVAANVLRYSHLCGPRRPRMPKIVEREIPNFRFVTRTHETLFYVIDSGVGADASEDKFSNRDISSYPCKNRSNALTHGNYAGFAVLALLNKQPAWKYIPDFTSY